MHTTCFWNNLRLVSSKSKDRKFKYFKSLWEQLTKGPIQYRQNQLRLRTPEGDLNFILIITFLGEMRS
jgi:hypothetical protein